MTRGYTVTCAQQGCATSYHNKSGWDSIRAQSKGWFEQKNGKSWCPEHVPDWVPAWREQQAREARYEACLTAGNDDDTTD